MKDPVSGKGKRQTLLGAVLTVIILVIMGVFRMPDGGNNEDASQSQQFDYNQETVEPLYDFRNEYLLDQHYEKHGAEMGFSTVEDYVAAANAVIQHPDVLHKLEAEDNDDIYFLEATGEFVVVSTDGYIRTYFIADGGIDYYNRQ